MPTASRLNAGLLGWNLFSLAMLPVHKDALSKLGLGYMPLRHCPMRCKPFNVWLCTQVVMCCYCICQTT